MYLTISFQRLSYLSPWQHIFNMALLAGSLGSSIGMFYFLSLLLTLYWVHILSDHWLVYAWPTGQLIEYAHITQRPCPRQNAMDWINRAVPINNHITSMTLIIRFISEWVFLWLLQLVWWFWWSSHTIFLNSIRLVWTGTKIMISEFPAFRLTTESYLYCTLFNRYIQRFY